MLIFNKYSKYIYVKRKFQRFLRRINQRVDVTELIAFQPHSLEGKCSSRMNLVGPKGEYRDSSNKYSGKISRLDRLKDYIKLLADIANKYHEQQYFVDHEDEKVLPKENKNKVTRLSMHEFALYTSKKPLSMKEYGVLLHAIDEMAIECHENLHLVLSSIPIQDSDGRINNVVLYVQCGKTPKIDVIVKAYPFSRDFNYKHTPLGRFQKLSAKQKSSPDTVPAAFPMLPDANHPEAGSINYGGLVDCETKGGARFITAVDICADHLFGVARKSLEQRLKGAKARGYDEFFPNQVSHVVTSNTIEVVPSNVLSQTVVHADPLYHAVKTLNKALPYKNIPSRFIDRLNRDKGLIDKRCYPETSIISDSGKTILVNNPQFGPRVEIQIVQEQSLGKLSNTQCAKLFEGYNNKVVREQAKRHVASSNHLGTLSERSMSDDLKDETAEPAQTSMQVSPA